MSVISDVATYLAANGIGTLNTSVFYSKMPDTTNPAVAVLDTGGTEPDAYVPIEDPTFQILIRANSYALGKAKLEAIKDLLHNFDNGYLVNGQTYFYIILAQSNGGHIGQNENGKDEFSINFRARIR